MDSKFDKIDGKLDKLDERLDVVDKHLAIYNEQLSHHIRRTEILENEMKPVKSHVTLMNNLAKIIIFLGILTAIYKNLQ